MGMKNLISFFAIFLISTSTQAGGVKEIYQSTQEEITAHYEAHGQWNLMRIESMEFINSKDNEFITVSAQTILSHTENYKKIMETCLVTFAQEDLSFQSLNCF